MPEAREVGRAQSLLAAAFQQVQTALGRAREGGYPFRMTLEEA